MLSLIKKLFFRKRTSGKEDITERDGVISQSMIRKIKELQNRYDRKINDVDFVIPNKNYLWISLREGIIPSPSSRLKNIFYFLGDTYIIAANEINKILLEREGMIIDFYTSTTRGIDDVVLNILPPRLLRKLKSENFKYNHEKQCIERDKFIKFLKENPSKVIKYINREDFLKFQVLDKINNPLLDQRTFNNLALIAMDLNTPLKLGEYDSVFPLGIHYIPHDHISQFFSIAGRNINYIRNFFRRQTRAARIRQRFELKSMLENWMDNTSNKTFRFTEKIKICFKYTKANKYIICRRSKEISSEKAIRKALKNQRYITEPQLLSHMKRNPVYFSKHLVDYFTKLQGQEDYIALDFISTLYEFNSSKLTEKNVEEVLTNLEAFNYWLKVKKKYTTKFPEYIIQEVMEAISVVIYRVRNNPKFKELFKENMGYLERSPYWFVPPIYGTYNNFIDVNLFKVFELNSGEIRSIIVRNTDNLTARIYSYKDSDNSLTEYTGMNDTKGTNEYKLNNLEDKDYVYIFVTAPMVSYQAGIYGRDLFVTYREYNNYNEEKRKHYKEDCLLIHLKTMRVAYGFSSIVTHDIVKNNTFLRHIIPLLSKEYYISFKKLQEKTEEDDE